MSASPAGPPGGGTFSLQDRPAAGLYLVAWLLSGLAVGLFLVATQTGPPVRGVLLMGALLLLSAGLAGAAGYQLVARRLRPLGAFRGPAPLILFALQVVVVNVVSLALLPLGVPLPDTAVGFGIAALVLLCGYVGVVWLFGVRSGALTWPDLGLPARVTVSRALADIGVASLTMILVALAAAVGAGLLARLLGTSSPEIVPPPDSVGDLLLVALGAGLLVPLGEELLFRGYALTAWLRDLGPRPALIRSTVFFALVHVLTLSSATFADGVRQALLVLAIIAPVGLALGWLFLRRGLLAAVAGHAAFNLFGILLMVLARSLPAPA